MIRFRILKRKRYAVVHRLLQTSGAGIALYDQSKELEKQVPKTISKKQPLEFQFVAPATSISGVEVKCATFMRKVSSHLLAELIDASGRTIATRRIDASEIGDNTYFPFIRDLASPLDEGARYKLRISSIDGTPGNLVAAYVSKTRSSEAYDVVRTSPAVAANKEVFAKNAVKQGVVALHRIGFTEEAVTWHWQTSFAENGGENQPKPLYPGQPLLVELIAPAERIDTIEVFCATYRNTVTSQIRATVFDHDGRMILSQIVSAQEIEDNTFHPFIRRPDVEFVRGGKYWLELSSVDGNKRNCIAVYLRSKAAGAWQYSKKFSRLSGRRVFEYITDSRRSEIKIAAVVDPQTVDDELLLGLSSRLARQPFYVIDADRGLRDGRIFAADLVVFANCLSGDDFGGASFDQLCFELHRHRITTLFYQKNGLSGLDAPFALAGPLKRETNALESRRRRCHFALIEGPTTSLIRSFDQSNVALSDGELDDAVCRSLIAEVRVGTLPHVAIVTVLYKKSDVVETFLDHVVRQSFPGRISVVVVDDYGKDDGGDKVLRYAERLQHQGVSNVDITLITNEENLGNCGSRNRGIAATEADLCVVIDCDCLINRDFVRAHVFEHWYPDVDAVVGPLNIETWGRDGSAMVRELESEPSLVAKLSEPQDPVQADAIVNAITRNFSFKRRLLKHGPMFDVNFAYSAKKDSGFGWEDVEMGFRLYEAGAVIRFTDQAFSVHCSHDSSMPEASKVLGSMKNFAQLFEKHPDMTLATRRWSTETYNRIMEWANRTDVDGGDARRKLDALFGEPSRMLSPLLQGYKPGAKRLKILTFRWHAPHQYELYKLPHDFTLVSHIGNGMVDRWEFDQRPLRDNARIVPAEEINPKDYDLAIIHFDENVMAPHLCNDVIPASWGEPMRYFLEKFGDLPKVSVCHGTVPFRGQYALNPERIKNFDLYEDERLALVRLLAEAKSKVVCNSYDALAEWQFEDARVIWHGFDPQEFYKGDNSRDILALSLDPHRPHYRGAAEQEIVERLLTPGLKIESARHNGAAIEIRGTNPFAVRNFRSYIDRISRFSVYLNTTLRSPMPRSRGEAMMTGVIPICLRNHDVDRWIENGVDGFYADTPEELAAFVNDLFADRSRLHEMSRAARRKAMDVFNHDRYLADWTNLIDEL